MKKVYILRGPSGVGKTTWAKKLADNWSGDTDDTDVQVTIVSADHFFEKRVPEVEFVDGGRMVDAYDFDLTKLPEAHQCCMNGFLRALLEEHPVIVVDNTNQHLWEYMNYEIAAKLAGYEVEIIEFMVKTVDQIRRLANRSVHGVPANVIAHKAVFMQEDTRATRIPVEGV